MFDWGDGEYEHTAAELAAAADHIAEVAAIRPGERVLDLGCGTGNAALAAARRGALVTAIDPAERLLAVARRRAAEAGVSVTFARGDAGAIPADDASFDALVSVFAVIFAPDADEAAAEMVRVLRAGGRAVISTWTPEGAIASAGVTLRQSMIALAPPQGAFAAPPRWGDPAYVEALFERHGARAEVASATLSFSAPSAEAWLQRQVALHPAWRAAARAHAALPEVWAQVYAKMLSQLEHGDEGGGGGWRVTSRYLVVTARRS